jgi:hypothetical protein
MSGGGGAAQPGGGGSCVGSRSPGAARHVWGAGWRAAHAAPWLGMGAGHASAAPLTPGSPTSRGSFNTRRWCTSCWARARYLREAAGGLDAVAAERGGARARMKRADLAPRSGSSSVSTCARTQSRDTTSQGHCMPSTLCRPRARGSAGEFRSGADHIAARRAWSHVLTHCTAPHRGAHARQPGPGRFSRCPTTTSTSSAPRSPPSTHRDLSAILKQQPWPRTTASSPCRMGLLPTCPTTRLSTHTATPMPWRVPGPWPGARRGRSTRSQAACRPRSSSSSAGIAGGGTNARSASSPRAPRATAPSRWPACSARTSTACSGTTRGRSSLAQGPRRGARVSPACPRMELHAPATPPGSSAHAGQRQPHAVP